MDKEAGDSEMGEPGPSAMAEALAHLDVWGLRIAGASFFDPFRWSTGRRAGVDDELALVGYLEETPGFARARPVLLHVHKEGMQDPRTCRVRGPGETLIRAYLRVGWGDLVGVSEADACEQRYREFVREHARRVEREPFVRPARAEEEDEGPVTAREREMMRMRKGA